MIKAVVPFSFLASTRKNRPLKKAWEVISRLTDENFDNTPQIYQGGISKPCPTRDSEYADCGNDDGNYYKREDTSKRQFF